jgi:hypothetical protein
VQAEASVVSSRAKRAIVRILISSRHRDGEGSRLFDRLRRLARRLFTREKTLPESHVGHRRRGRRTAPGVATSERLPALVRSSMIQRYCGGGAP